MTETRSEDFKIGCFHGKLFAEDRGSEAQLRNELFLIGMLKVEITRRTSIDIRIVAYEMPLQTGQSRGNCIDLFGYDKDKRPWIIELKKKSSFDNIEKIKKEINGYARSFQKIRGYVEKEIREKFHWNDFKFSEGTGKIILAGREFFQKRNLKREKLESYKSGIYYCSFGRIQDEIKKGKVVLLENNKRGVVNLAVQNK